MFQSMNGFSSLFGHFLSCVCLFIFVLVEHTHTRTAKQKILYLTEQLYRKLSKFHLNKQYLASNDKTESADEEDTQLDTVNKKEHLFM